MEMESWLKNHASQKSIHTKSTIKQNLQLGELMIHRFRHVISLYQIAWSSHLFLEVVHERVEPLVRAEEPPGQGGGQDLAQGVELGLEAVGDLREHGVQLDEKKIQALNYLFKDFIMFPFR